MELQVHIWLNMIVPSPTYRAVSYSFQVPNLISIRSEISIQHMCPPYFMNVVLGNVSAWLDVQWINLLSSRFMLLLTMIGEFLIFQSSRPHAATVTRCWTGVFTTVDYTARTRRGRPSPITRPRGCSLVAVSRKLPSIVQYVGQICRYISFCLLLYDEFWNILIIFS